MAFVNPKGIHLWDFGRSEPHALAPDVPVGIAFSRDGKRLWGIVGEHEIKTWPVEDAAKPTTWADPVRDLVAAQAALTTMTAGARWALVGSLNQTVYLMRRSDGQKERDLVRLDSPPSSLALSRDETVAAIGTQSGRILLVRVPDGKQLASIEGHGDVVLAVAISPDGELLASSGRDGRAHLWNRASSTTRKVAHAPKRFGQGRHRRRMEPGRKVARAPHQE